MSEETPKPAFEQCALCDGSCAERCYAEWPVEGASEPAA